MFWNRSLVQIATITSVVLLTASVAITSVPLLAIAKIESTRSFYPASNISRSRTILAKENQRRIALVIGNSNYRKQGILPNSLNDANDMAKALSELGFEVVKVIDGDKKAMEAALEKFNGQLSRGGVGLFYYAGHGIQVDGENYLIPVDAVLNNQKDVNYEALPVGKVQNAMEYAETEVNIIILDACRNNPFNRRWTRNTQNQGLAPIQAITGSFIAFATSPGMYAEDGTSKNGTYTSYILKYIKTPNLSIEELFKKVRQGVSSETDKRQIPWESTSLIGDFSFNSEEATVVTNTPTPSSSDSEEKVNPNSVDNSVTSLSLTEIIAKAPKDNPARNTYLAKEVKTYLERGGDPNTKTDKGFTSLHVAVVIGSKELITLALTEGANIDAKNNDGATGLHAAVSTGDKEIIAFLLTKGADVNAKINNGGTSLHLAVSLGNKKILEPLLTKEIVELLLAKGADINAKENNGFTSLHLAVAFANKEIVELLLTKGADINARANDGFTSLHNAANTGNKEIVELLLAKGADVNARTNDGYTPLDVALASNHTGIIKLLKQHGAVDTGIF